jgi:hypothetical protein
MIEKPTRGSPVDAILIAASSLFPLDFFLLTFIVKPRKILFFLSSVSTHFFIHTDTVSLALLVSRNCVLRSALHLHQALRHKKTSDTTARLAVVVHVSFVAGICNAVANCITCAAGTD